MTPPRLLLQRSVQYFRAGTTLTFLSFRRLLWSVGTLMLVFPPAACALFVVRRDYGSIADDVEAFNHFSGFLLFVYTSFVVPLCAVTFGGTSVGGDRDDGTLVFLLVRPLPRSLIVAAKFAAALPLSVGFACGGFWVLCRLAGAPGRMALDAYLPAVFYLTIAYTALFLFFGALFRHAVIVGLLYTLFMDVLLGTVPGIIKRSAISYYGRSLMFDAGAKHGLEAPDPQWFEPLSGDAARTVLAAVTIGSLAAAWLVFRLRDFDDAP